MVSLGQIGLRKRRRQKIMQAIRYVLSEFEVIENTRLAYYASQRLRCSVDKGYATRLAREMGYKTELVNMTVDGRFRQVKIISTR